MRVHCWGSRGSVPVSGRDYLKYGGDTTCIEVESAGGDLIIIDAGTGIRVLGNKLLSAKDKRSITLLLTHAHWDHLSGFPFFKPIYMKDTKISIYGPEHVRDSLKHIISKTMSYPYFPVEFDKTSADIKFVDEGSLGVGPIKISSVPLSHPNQGSGYRLDEGDKSFVFITDNEFTHPHEGGLKFEDYRDFSRGADLLIHDAEFKREEYDRVKGWGHSVYDDALELALAAGAKKFGLFHLNQDRTDADADLMLEECRRKAALKDPKLECVMVAAGMDFTL
jgi:phosphoribosyl 1,2-cyclic phosphodiesterase